MNKIRTLIIIILLALATSAAAYSLPRHYFDPTPETAEYQCQMTFAETGDLEPDVIVGLCQP